MRIPIYLSEKIIYLTDDPKIKDAKNSFSLKEVTLKFILKRLKDPDVIELFLYHHNSNKLLLNFRKKIKTVIAGGGKVINTDGDVLFIYRNGKWDLPKGRIEKDETIEEGAMREVKEETGVKKLKLIGPIGQTYHLFKRNSETKLKITHWFDMSSTYSGKLSPEENEGITKVKWLNADKIQKVSKKSYANIRSLLTEKINAI